MSSTLGGIIGYLILARLPSINALEYLSWITKEHSRRDGHLQCMPRGDVPMNLRGEPSWTRTKRSRERKTVAEEEIRNDIVNIIKRLLVG